MFNLYKIKEEDLAVLREAGFLDDPEKCKVEKDVLKSGFECYKVGFDSKEDHDRAYRALLEVTEEEEQDVKNNPHVDAGSKPSGKGNAGSGSGSGAGGSGRGEKGEHSGKGGKGGRGRRRRR